MPNLNPPPPSGDAGMDQWLTKLYQNISKAKNWTPVLTCGTPGDLVSSGGTQTGEFFRVGPLYIATWTMAPGTFTHTTSAGTVSITGLPVAANSDSGYAAVGGLQWGGITLANYTQWTPFITSGGTSIGIVGNGSGQAQQVLRITDMPTGGTVILRGFLIYR